METHVADLLPVWLFLGGCPSSSRARMGVGVARETVFLGFAGMSSWCEHKACAWQRARVGSLCLQETLSRPGVAAAPVHPPSSLSPRVYPAPGLEHSNVTDGPPLCLRDGRGHPPPAPPCLSCLETLSGRFPDCPGSILPGLDQSGAGRGCGKKGEEGEQRAGLHPARH